MRLHNVFKLFVEKVKKQINREFLTWLVFLLIAITIWYLNALNEEYTTDLRFAVRYTDLPEDKVLANTPPDRLALTVNAQGFTLLKYRLGLILSPITLEASYNTLRRNNNAEQSEYFLTTQSVFNRISTQLSSDINLRDVSPDTLTFVFTETIRRDVPVKPVLNLQFEKGYLPKDKMLVEPEKVSVTGPQTIIDTMQFVYTKPKFLRRLKETLSVSLELQPVQQLRYSVDEVKIVQTIERYTEASVTVPVEPVNMPEGVTMRVFPATITVNCLVPVVDYEKLQPHMFRSVVDYNSVKDATDNQTKARVIMQRMPEYLADVKFHPTSVDFIIEK